jgi:predicted NBD/HSP70 family sugar kinase
LPTPTPRWLVRDAGSTIGHVLASLVTFYNPSLIVIGGGVAKIGDLLLASIRESVYRRSLPLCTRNLTISGSSLGDTAV